MWVCCRLASVLKTVFLFTYLGASLIYILVASLILMALLEMGFLKKKVNFTIEFFFSIFFFFFPNISMFQTVASLGMLVYWWKKLGHCTVTDKP